MSDEQPKGVDWNHPARAQLVIKDAQQGIVEAIPELRKKIAICGFACSSRDQIPVDDREWEIWGLNQLYRHITRMDRHFDIHCNWNDHVVEGTDHAAWIRTAPIPVYMNELRPEFPSCVRYPLETLINQPDYGQDYFTSTVAFMLALAIWEIDKAVAKRGLTLYADVKNAYREYKIGIFGIDLIVGEEWDYQKPCAEHWIGVALGRGIDVDIPQTSALLKQSHRYGYQMEPDFGLIKMSDLSKREETFVAQFQEARKRCEMLEGGLMELRYWKHLLELRMRGGQVG